MLKYTVKVSDQPDKIYKGFCRLHSLATLRKNPGLTLVVTWCDDQPELYLVEPENELRRFLDENEEADTTITLWKEVTDENS